MGIRTKKKIHQQLTVGIPTYYGDPSIVKTVKSIVDSVGICSFRLIVAVDGNPLKKKVKKGLEKLGAEVVLARERGGQVARLKQIITMTETDYLILTQDDVLFKPDTISHLVAAFGDDRVSMAGARIMPMKAQSWFERVIEVGVSGNTRLGKMWREGNNYLLASGRCLAFRTKVAKQFVIREEVINSDAYFYFENKRLGGKFQYVDSAVVLNKSPHTLQEHLKQSRKFQISQAENSKYLGSDLSDEYKVPNSLKLKAGVQEFAENPLLFSMYLMVNLYTRLAGRDMFAEAQRFWETDISTKRI